MSQHIPRAERLRLLSVRILNDKNTSFGSGFLYIHNEVKAYVLTAAHVIQAIKDSDVIVIECPPDLDDERKEKGEDYRFTVDRSAARFANKEKTEYAEDDVEDVAVIVLNVEAHPRIQKRDKVGFAPENCLCTEYSVTGCGYPVFKDYKAIEKASVRAESGKAKCTKHTADHFMEWNLGIDVREPDSGEETHGWSGSVMVLADQEPFMLVGFVLSMPKGYKGGETYGADMYHARRILKTEFGITVREAKASEKTLRDVAPANSGCGLPPSPPRSAFWIEGSRDTIINRMKSCATPNSPLFLCGPAGCGKTELARAIAAEYRLGGTSYTIQYLLSEIEGEDNLKASLLAASIDGQQFLGGTVEERETEFYTRMRRLRICENQTPQWIIIDDLYHPEKTLEKLLHEESFQRLLELGHYLICTTRYDLNGNNRFRVPFLFEDEEKHKCALLELIRTMSEGAEITAEQFEEYYELTDGNLLMADWTAKTLRTGLVEMQEILDALKTGNFTNEDGFPEIADERTGIIAPFDAHICKLYNMDHLDSEDRKTVALLQFAGADGLAAKLIKQWMPGMIKSVMKMLDNGWCGVKKQQYYMDPVLKLACRCNGVCPERGELKSLLYKMYEHYKSTKLPEHRAMIRAYYEAASCHFDEEMQMWHEEIRHATQKEAGEENDRT